MPQILHPLRESPPGLILGVTNYGDHMTSRLVVMCHPVELGGAFDPDPLETLNSGIRLVALDLLTDPSRVSLTDADADFESVHRRVSPFEHAAAIAVWLRDMQAILRPRGQDHGSVGVLGWGTGCLLATALTHEHPDLVDRVVLVQPTFRLPDSADRADTGISTAPTCTPQTRGLSARLERSLSEKDLPGSVRLWNGDEVSEQLYERCRALAATTRPGPSLVRLTASSSGLASINDPLPLRYSDHARDADRSYAPALKLLTFNWSKALAYFTRRRRAGIVEVASRRPRRHLASPVSSAAWWRTASASVATCAFTSRSLNGPSAMGRCRILSELGADAARLRHRQGRVQHCALSCHVSSEHGASSSAGRGRQRGTCRRAP